MQKKSTTTLPSSNRGGKRSAPASQKSVSKKEAPRQQTRKPPVLVKGNWRDNILTTDQLDQVVDIVQGFKTSYVSSYYSTKLVPKLVDVITQRPQAKIIVCYGRKRLLDLSKSDFKGAVIFDGEDLEGLNLNSQVILTTTAKAKNLLRKVADAGVTTHIFMTGCQEYGAMTNTAVLYGLIKHYNINARVMVNTISKWKILPSNFSPSQEDSVVYTNNNVRFLYYENETPKMLMSTLKGKVAYGGKWIPESEFAEYNVELVYGLSNPQEFDHVICVPQNLYRINVDYCGNSLISGIVHVLWKESGLQMENEAEARVCYNNMISRIAIWLDNNKIPLTILPKECLEEAKNCLKPIPQDIRKEVIALNKKGLDIPAAILNCRWSSANHNMIRKLLSKYNMETNKTFRRSLYVPILVSCLINNSPSHYGDIQSLKSFQGRNDIEILSSMWLDLINSHSYPFYLWDDRAKDNIIRNWCREKGMNLSSITRTFDLISYLYNIAIEILDEDVMKYNKGPVKFFNDFGALVTTELNEAMDQIKSSGAYTITSSKSYRTDSALVPNPGSNIVILHQNNKNVSSYISDFPLEIRVYKVEDDSLFDPL